MISEVVDKTEKVSTDFWKELSKEIKLVTTPIPGIDDELMSTNIIPEYIVKVFKNMFPSLFDPEKQAEIEDIRNYLILKIGLRFFTSDDLYDVVINLKSKHSFNELLERENKKELSSEDLAAKRKEDRDVDDFLVNYSDDDAVDSQGGANYFETDGRSVVAFRKSRINDFVFVNLDSTQRIVRNASNSKLDWFPKLVNNFSFLSGSVNRNYNQIGSKSLLTPLGYHGESLGTTFNLESDNTISAPTPDSLKIKDDKKYQKQFLNDKDEIDYESLFLRPGASKFVVPQTISLHLSMWLQYIGFGDKVTSETTEWGVSNLNIESNNGVDKISNVGSGVSQALPVIMQILLSENKVLFLEEVEQNLHASAQARLADMILLFSLDPKRNFIIETHSEHLINRLRLWKMQLGKVFDPDIKSPYNVYFATRDAKKGTTLKRMDTDKDGYFTVDNFPDGFFDQAQKDIKEIMERRFEEK